MANNVILTKDITKVFTEVVNGYLAKGMMYHINSMSGSQGEIAKVDLTDGTDVYRIMLNSETSFEDDFWGDKIVLIVEKHAGRHSDEMRSADTIWNGRGEEVYKKEWFSIDGRNRSAYTDDLEEAKACFAKQHERYKNRKSNKDDDVINVTSEDKLTILRDMCRTHKGYARVKRCHISHMIKQDSSYSTCYIVVFNNGKSPLMIKRIEK